MKFESSNNFPLAYGNCFRSFMVTLFSLFLFSIFFSFVDVLFFFYSLYSSPLSVLFSLPGPRCIYVYIFVVSAFSPYILRSEQIVDEKEQWVGSMFRPFPSTHPSKTPTITSMYTYRCICCTIWSTENTPNAVSDHFSCRFYKFERRSFTHVFLEPSPRSPMSFFFFTVLLRSTGFLRSLVTPWPRVSQETGEAE